MNKISIIIIVFICCISCNYSEEKVSETKQINNMRRVVNLGASDDPQNFNVEYIGHLVLNKKTYSNIYGFIYKLEIDTSRVDTLYYETLNRDAGIDFSEFDIELFPGNATIKVSAIDKKEYILFHVLESQEYRHEYKGKFFDHLPTISQDKTGNYCSDNPISFNINKTKPKIYNITFKEFSKVISIDYELIGNSIKKLSYLNRNTGNVYTIDKSVYLKPIKKVNFIDYH